MTTLKFIIAVIAVMLLSSGCKTRDQIIILQSYPYEAVYDHNVPVTVNGKLLDRSKEKERIWILSDRSMGRVLYDAKQHHYK